MPPTNINIDVDIPDSDPPIKSYFNQMKIPIVKHI